MKINPNFETTLYLKQKSLLFLLLLFSLSSFAQTTYFVDVNRPDNSGNGLSFSNAFKDLQVAIDVASVGDEIRVAQGIYLPTEGPEGPSDEMFHLDKDLIIRGGFDAVTGLQDLSNPTTLSGDFNGDDVVNGIGASLNINIGSGGAARTVLLTVNLTNACIIDGFMITGGRAVGGPYVDFSGVTIGGFAGGLTNINSSLTLTNITFFGNQCDGNGSAGGMNIFGTSSPILNNVTFSKNYAYFDGGGINSSSQSLSLTNVTFFGNYAGDQGGGLRCGSNSNTTLTNVVFDQNFTYYSGGGMSVKYNATANLTNVIFSSNSCMDEGGGMFARETGVINFINVVFCGNNAGTKGGGLHNYYTNGAVNLTNVTFTRNSAGTDGGGMYNLSPSQNPTLHNSVFYANTIPSGINDVAGGSIHYSSVNNASDGIGINTSFNFIALSADPFFYGIDFDGVDNIFGTTDDGLMPDSVNNQLINAGDNTKNSQATDVAGQARVFDTTIDIGAYEYDSSALGIDENNFMNDIILYPNPSDAQITIVNRSNILLKEATIYDTQGRLVLTIDLINMEKEKSINILKLQSGSYIMVIKSELGQVTKMLVKQ